MWVLASSPSSSSSRVYRRSGVTADNFLGSHWAAVSSSSSSLTCLSASACDSALALDASGKVLRLEAEEVSLTVPRMLRPEREADMMMAVPKIADENVDGGWAVVV